MKYFLISLIVSVLITGCATRNAFSMLEITPDQELAVENTRSGQIRVDKKVSGVFSAIYLNNVYPNMKEDTNLFYVSVYTKKKNSDVNITMNGNSPVDIREILYETKLNSLLPIKTAWTKNYLVSFENIVSAGITLTIENGQYSSGPLTYSKDNL